MTKTIGLLLICSMFSGLLYTSLQYTGSTTAAVTISGAIIKSQHVDTTKKYKRSECPVCKGKGWYISGDGIAKVSCGYCEPDKPVEAEKSPRLIINKR